MYESYKLCGIQFPKNSLFKFSSDFSSFFFQAKHVLITTSTQNDWAIIFSFLYVHCSNAVGTQEDPLQDTHYAKKIHILSEKSPIMKDDLLFYKWVECNK